MDNVPAASAGGNLVPRPAPDHSRTAVGPTLDVNQALTLGRVLAESGLFPDARAAAQAVVKVLAGRELGFGPVASMTGINVIKGRIALSANLIAAAIRRSGRYDYEVKRLDDQACQIDFLMGSKVAGTSHFSLEDARKAGLATGDNWKKYPRNMLFARAMSNGAKSYCPDVFGGAVYTPDELEPGARIDPETGGLVQVCSAATEADTPRPETAYQSEDLHAQVAALVEATGTDVARLLDHYHVTDLTALTTDQCAEAIQVLTARTTTQSVPNPT